MVFRRIAPIFGLLVTLSLPLHAHTILDAPNGGEVFQVKDITDIVWHVFIEHDTQNWDLSYSTVGPEGPWTSIVEDLPAGDIQTGAIHTFPWAIPLEAAAPQVWIQVVQDNSGTDYTDESDASFAIEGGSPPIAFARGDCNSDGAFGLGDAIVLLAYVFTAGPEPACLDACDFDDSDALGLPDAIGTLNFLFSMGIPPSPPHPDCGPDPTVGLLGCDGPTAGCP